MKHILILLTAVILLGNSSCRKQFKFNDIHGKVIVTDSVKNSCNAYILLYSGKDGRDKAEKDIVAYSDNFDDSGFKNAKKKINVNSLGNFYFEMNEDEEEYYCFAYAANYKPSAISEVKKGKNNSFNFELAPLNTLYGKITPEYNTPYPSYVIIKYDNDSGEYRENLSSSTSTFSFKHKRTQLNISDDILLNFYDYGGNLIYSEKINWPANEVVIYERSF